MEAISDTLTDRFMHHTDSASVFSSSETSPTPRRIVSFYPTSEGSSALWSDDLELGTDALSYPQGFSKQQLGSVTGLHAWIIEARSPLIAAAFESSVSGNRLHLDSLDSGTVIPFVRFLYTGHYASHGDWEDVPTSVWLHCRMYYLGHLYDLADLKSQAYVNVLRQCEFGCSSPNTPIDLCPAIDFVYRQLSGHDAISDALVQYCVTRCLSHKLHEIAEFRHVAFSVRAFHQDLTKACRDRDYEDESAAIIIQLPYMHYAPATYASTEDPPISRFEDIIHYYHSTDRFDEISPKKRQRVTLEEKRASPKKVPKLQEHSERSQDGLKLLKTSSQPVSVTSGKQSTLDIETKQAKLPEDDAVHGMQQSPSASAHMQRPQVINHNSQQEVRMRPTSAGKMYQTAQRVLASLAEEERTKVREDVLRGMSEQQIHQASARKQDPLWQYIYQKVEQEDVAAGAQQSVPSLPTFGEVITAQSISRAEEEKSQLLNDATRKMHEHQRRQVSHDQFVFEKVREEVMNRRSSTQAASDQQQLSGLPLRPAFEMPTPATTEIMVKLPMRPLYPSSADVDANLSPKNEKLPIWKRRDMSGASSGLSQALETSRTQDKQSQGPQSFQASVSQKLRNWAMDQPQERIEQRKPSETEIDAAGRSPPSAQPVSIPCGGAIRGYHTQSMQEGPLTGVPQDDPFKFFPNATTPAAPVAVTSLPVGPNSGNHALQDYQMQLMLLEQQNKIRLLRARQEQDPMADPCMRYILPPGLTERPDETGQERALGTGIIPRDARIRRYPAPVNASSAVEATGEPGIVKRASTLEEPSVPHPSEDKRVPSSNYQAQLRLLDEHNKKRGLMAQAERDSLARRTDTAARASASKQPPVPHSGKIQSPALSDYNQRRLRPLGEQNKKGEVMGQAEGERIWRGTDTTTHTADSSQPSVPRLGETQRVDHQMQLMLLEQQNKKRLLMARQAEDVEREANLSKKVSPSTDTGSSSASDSARDAPVPQLSEAQTLESYQAQPLPFEQARMENQSRQCVRRSPTDPVSTAALESASRATSTENVDVSTGDRRQDGITFDHQQTSEAGNPVSFDMEFAPLATPGGDALEDFDFDAFLSNPQTDFWDFGLQQDVSVRDSGSHADSDSDAQSWVDVALEPTSNSRETSPTGTAATRRASIQVPTSAGRSPSHSDSEWELC